MEESTLIGCGTLLVGFAGVIVATRTARQKELRAENEWLKSECKRLNAENLDLLRRYIRRTGDTPREPKGDEYA